MDDTYQNYINRVAQMTLLQSYKSQLEYIQPSPKFTKLDGQFQAKSFPGYSVITPPGEEDSRNSNFYQHLQKCQEQLMELFGPNLMIPVPGHSFHLTLADLIWESAFINASQNNPQFEEKLRSCITESFQELSISTNGHQIQWQIFGIIVMTRAVGVCLVPKDESSYEQVLKLRRSIYQNPNFIALGIEQQYHLTAHVTLGYFGEIPSDLDIAGLADSISELNHQWLETTPEILVYRGELRKFDDMISYYRESDWPVVDLP
ncbi:MAG: DUF1868 domain-containing protein [Okeania sp. SIO2F4]|nr:DUF1868 domain-containing protein [Trichodesmium sp. MO_231.B1]NES04439.1 DUF1868 domain-containing protein [Okeania sp. SIO2F4]